MSHKFTQRSEYKLKALARILLVLLFGLVFPTPAFAYIPQQFGVWEVAQGDVVTIRGIERIFYNIISAALPFAALVLFVMFLIGGFKYLTSNGDPKATEAAKGTLTHAIIGLVVLLLAYVILVFVKTITGVDVTTFGVTR